MEKAQILSTLKANIGATDTRFDKTLENFIDANNLTTVQDAELKLEQYTPNLKFFMEQSYGLSNHEIAEAKKKWDAEHNSKQPEPEKPQPDKNNSDMEKFIAEQNAKFQELQKQIEGYKQKQTTDAIRAEVTAKSKELDANQGIWKMAVANVEIANDATVETVTELVKAEYGKLYKDVFGDSKPPFGGNNPKSPEEQIKANLDDFFKSKGFK